MVIEDHTNGILVPVGNVEQLSQAMQEVLEDENLSKKMSLNGVKLRERFSVENIAKQWIDFAEEKKK